MRSTLFERMSDIARGEGDKAELAAIVLPPPAPGARAPGITDAEAKLKNKALVPLVMWLTADSMTAEKLEAASAADLAKRYPPITADDIAQMIRVRLKRLRAAR